MSFSPRAAQTFTLAALAAAGLAACTAEPRYPIREGEAAGGGVQPMQPRYPVRATAPAASSPPPAAPRDDDAPRAAPSGKVSSRALPPPTSPAQPVPYADYLARKGARAPKISAPEAAPAPSPGVETTTAAAPSTPTVAEHSVTVAAGETLFDIAERERTPVRAVIDLNGLQPPYALAPGAVLRIPPPLVYRVQAGDTLFGVARRFNIDARSLATLNGLTPGAGVSPGQGVMLPSLARDQGANAQARGASPAGSRGYSFARAGRPASTPRAGRGYASLGHKSAGIASTPSDPGIAPQALQPVPDTPPPTVAEITVLGRRRFVWPVHGAILSGFGDKAPGQRNDGVNIAAGVGDPVHSAAAGEVVYAGNQIPGFGNLVLVKHPGGWVTAYAHLSHIDVKMREAVTQGEALGEAGQTGAVLRPQVHFEIRYAPSPAEKARPIDPTTLLPAAG